MRTSSWALPVLSTVSLLVIAGSLGWAEATQAEPHAEPTEAAAPAAGPDGETADGSGLTFQICAGGNYPTYVTLPDDGNLKSATAQPGKCLTQALTTDAEHSVKIFGLEGTTPFEVGEDEVAPGEKLTGTGTIESPDYTVE